MGGVVYEPLMVEQVPTSLSREQTLELVRQALGIATVDGPISVEFHHGGANGVARATIDIPFHEEYE